MKEHRQCWIVQATAGQGRGVRTRRNTACGRLTMACGRCRLHGAPLGARTVAGLERIRKAKTTHDRYSAENRQVAAMVRALKAGAKRLVELT